MSKQIHQTTVTVGTVWHVFGRPVAMRDTPVGLVVFYEVEQDVATSAQTTVMVVPGWTAYEGRHVDTVTRADGLIAHLVVVEP